MIRYSTIPSRIACRFAWNVLTLLIELVLYSICIFKQSGMTNSSHSKNMINLYPNGIILSSKLPSCPSEKSWNQKPNEKGQPQSNRKRRIIRLNQICGTFGQRFHMSSTFAEHVAMVALCSANTITCQIFVSLTFRLALFSQPSASPLWLNYANEQRYTVVHCIC